MRQRYKKRNTRPNKTNKKTGEVLRFIFGITGELFLDYWEFYVSNLETYVPNLETPVPNLETYVPNLET